MNSVRRRILVTRAAAQAGRLSEALRAAGFDPVEVPLLEILPLESAQKVAELDHALQGLSSYDWLILTSANTVRVLGERMKISGVSAEGSRVQVAAIGDATARAARSAGFTVSLVPESYVAEELVAALQTRLDAKIRSEVRSELGSERRFGAGSKVAPLLGARTQPSMADVRVLIARAAVARDVIPDELRKSGAQVDIVEAYRNAMPQTAPAQLRQALEGGIDAVALTSSSSVTHLAEAALQADLPFPFANIPAVSIGPITSQTLRAVGWNPTAEASPSNIDGLVAAIVLLLSH